MSEVRFRRKDGGTLWTIKATSPVRDEEGRHVGLVSFFTDITARKEAEAALRESEARHRAYFEHGSRRCERGYGVSSPIRCHRPSW